MKIKIKECILKMTLDLEKFKLDFQDEWEFENAVKDNLSIDFSDKVPNDKAKNLIYLGLDWGGLFRQGIDSHELKFKAYNVDLEGYKQYEPLNISNPKEFELSEKELKDAVMIVQDGVPNPNFCINNLFYMTIFHFGHKKYNLEVSEDGM